MNYMEKYSFWLENASFDVNTKKELLQIQNNQQEILDRFGSELEFGTGGLRGVMEAGTNRMNIYTVRKASQGLAATVAGWGEEAKKRGIVIAYDSRHNSDVFAIESARVFAANGITAYLFESPRPTPILSFAVWYLFASAGVVITASHNPKEYNGYKVYSEDGGQMTPDGTGAIADEIKKVEDITAIPLLAKEEAMQKGLLHIIGTEVDDAYFSCILKLPVSRDTVQKYACLPKIVYTPLHGVGFRPVMRMFNELGYANVVPVPSQQKPDGEFPTLTSTLNPEDEAVYAHALAIAQNENADLVLATDPDCDRVGVLSHCPGGEYKLLTGNEVGALVLDYMLRTRRQNGELPEDGFIVKTIVTTGMAEAIAAKYGVETVNVLTGFKYIGAKILELDEIGGRPFLFGMEDSCGYLAGTCVRDKDGVIGCMLVAEAASYYKSQGLTLWEGLQQLYKEYGYYLTELVSLKTDGQSKEQAGMVAFQQLDNSGLKNAGISALNDYSKQTRFDFVSGAFSPLPLPKSDVLLYEFANGSWFCIRPSGTESKMKIYFEARGQTQVEASQRLDDLKKYLFDSL